MAWGISPPATQGIADGPQAGSPSVSFGPWRPAWVIWTKIRAPSSRTAATMRFSPSSARRSDPESPPERPSEVRCTRSGSTITSPTDFARSRR